MSNSTAAGIPDFTIICACDASHVEELRLSYATWAKHKPSLLRRPLMIGCDLHTAPVDPSGEWYREQLGREIMGHPGGVRLKFIYQGENWTVRERMVSWFVFGVRHIETPYYLKCDADLIATAGPDDWIDPDWFRGSPAVIAPKWNYTKPYTMLDDLDRWAEKTPLSAGPRVVRKTQWPSDGSVRSRIAKHPRFISYCQFGRTDWTLEMAEFAGERLPCPSQDTFLSYCAHRSGALVHLVDMKARGWRHVGSNINKLRAAAAEAMEQPVA